MKRRVLIALMLAWSAVARAEVPLPGALDRGAWQRVGSGSLDWFVLRVYDATLWRGTPGEALAIRYARDIPATALIDTTFEEMARLGVSDAERWRAPLSAIFPDVQEGEVLVALREAGKGVQFFHQGRPVGRIAEAAFGEAFFGIWLDPRTREPALRAQLLGEARP